MYSRSGGEWQEGTNLGVPVRRVPLRRAAPVRPTAAYRAGAVARPSTAYVCRPTNTVVFLTSGRAAAASLASCFICQKLVKRITTV